MIMPTEIRTTLVMFQLVWTYCTDIEQDSPQGGLGMVN